MYDNVFEWCMDQWCDTYKGEAVDDSDWGVATMLIQCFREISGSTFPGNTGRQAATGLYLSTLSPSETLSLIFSSPYPESTSYYCHSWLSAILSEKQCVALTRSDQRLSQQAFAAFLDGLMRHSS